jgi:hypothetical protein
MFALVRIGKKSLTFGALAAVQVTEEKHVEAHRRCADLIAQASRTGVAMAVPDAYLRGMADARLKPM